MSKRRQAGQLRQDQSFKGRQFNAEVILWSMRWYLMFPISYRDLELMLLDRGVAVYHNTIFRCWYGRPPSGIDVPEGGRK